MTLALLLAHVLAIGATPALPCPVTAPPGSAAEATVWYAHQAEDGTMPYRTVAAARVPAGGVLQVEAEGHPVAVEWRLVVPGSGTVRHVCGEVPASVFADGLESASTDRWSVVRP